MNLKKKPSNYNNVEVGEEDSAELLASKQSPGYIAGILGLISFFTLSGARPGIFIAPHLLMNGWTEKNIGFALFIGGITTL